MFLCKRKNFIFMFLINNSFNSFAIKQNSNIFNKFTKKDPNLSKSKTIKNSYVYRPFVNCVNCYNDNANKSVLINKNYQKRALNFLGQLQNADFQNKLKENPDKVFKEYNLTPNEISFILFKLYHPKDHNFDKSIIDAILQSSYLEFDKKRFEEFQNNFDIFLKEYKDLEIRKSCATEEQIDEINEKLREKRKDMQLSPLVVLLDNLAFPVKNATNCFNVWCQSNYELKYVPGYKALSPAGLCYFLLCILKNSCLFRDDQESSYGLSSKIDQTKLTIINDSRFILEDFMEANSSKSPFSFYKDQFELKFLSIFHNL